PISHDSQSLAKLAAVGVCRHLLYPFIHTQRTYVNSSSVLCDHHYRLERISRLAQNLSKFCVILLIKTIDVGNELLKIAVVGPESTGKSTMAQYLAEKLQTVCVPEYSRYYCQGLNNQYTLQDEVNM